MLTLLAEASNPLEHVLPHELLLVPHHHGPSLFTNQMFMATVAGVLMLWIFPKLFKSADPSAPRGVKNFFESILEFLRIEVIRPALKEHTDRFVPFLWTLFFFILFCNLLGFIPIAEFIALLTWGKIQHLGGTATGTVSSEIDALCREAGILRVASLRHLRLAGKVFGSHPDGIGPRALVVSNSGGPGVLTADQAVLEGLELVDLPDALAQRLRAALPVEAAVANPLDLLADARADRFETTLRAILEEVPGRIDVVLMIHVVPFMVDAESVVLAIAGIAKYSPIPMMHSMMGTLERKAEWFQMLARVGVPAFNDSEEMCIAAGMLARYRELRQRLGED